MDFVEKHLRIARAELQLIHDVLKARQGRILDLSGDAVILDRIYASHGRIRDAVVYDRDSGQGKLRDGLPEKILSQKYDLIVCAFKLHHIAVSSSRLPQRFLDEVSVVAAPGALMLILDVPAATRAAALAEAEIRDAALSTARFFTEVVDIHSMPGHGGENATAERTGHFGTYVDMPALMAQFQHAGWCSRVCAVRRCDWVFEHMGIAPACRHIVDVFDLDRARESAWGARLASMLVEEPGAIRFPWALDSALLEFGGPA